MTQQKFRGVCAHKDGGFVASIGHHGKQEYLGYFKNFSDAKAARQNAELRIFGHHLERKSPKIVADTGYLPLHGHGGKFYGWARVDEQDFPLVQQISWTRDPRGYVVGRPAGMRQTVTLHQFIMAPSRGYVIDHKNHDKLDNRRKNLRVCRQSENSKNTLLAKNNTSGAKGVGRTANGRWYATIWNNREAISLGRFDSVAAASAAYDAAARRLHGEFASPNSQILQDDSQIDDLRIVRGSVEPGGVVEMVA